MKDQPNTLKPDPHQMLIALRNQRQDLRDRVDTLGHENADLRAQVEAQQQLLDEIFVAVGPHGTATTVVERITDLRAKLAEAESKLTRAESRVRQARIIARTLRGDDLAMCNSVSALLATLDAEPTPGPGTLQARVTAWARATFPDSTDHGRLTHLAREVAELQDDPSAADEMADVALILLHHASAHSVDLLDACERKFAVVQNREWGQPDAEGVVEHVRDRAGRGGGVL
jgi:hypothetical protein